MRPIDADALTEDLINNKNFYPAIVQRAVEKAPTIEAEPVKHGRWIGTADGYADGELVYDIWECSECGYDADGADEKPNWNYCPNCGCKMDLEG